MYQLMHTCMCTYRKLASIHKKNIFFYYYFFSHSHCVFKSYDFLITMVWNNHSCQHRMYIYKNSFIIFKSRYQPYKIKKIRQNVYVYIYFVFFFWTTIRISFLFMYHRISSFHSLFHSSVSLHLHLISSLWYPL